MVIQRQGNLLWTKSGLQAIRACLWEVTKVYYSVTKLANGSMQPVFPCATNVCLEPEMQIFCDAANVIFGTTRKFDKAQLNSRDSAC